jgi:hypothetical protein
MDSFSQSARSHSSKSVSIAFAGGRMCTWLEQRWIDVDLSKRLVLHNVRELRVP